MMRTVALAAALTPLLATAAGSALESRVDRLNDALSLDERITLVHGFMAVPGPGRPLPVGAIPSAGYVPGIARLGIPAQYQSDGPVGVTNPRNARPGDGATALPSALALAATFDPQQAFDSGALMGQEARAKGFNVLLAASVNLARDPRGGRNFENLGEDPLLAGLMGGQVIRGVQSNAVISTVKHFAANDQESARHDVDAQLDEASLRESDLLAFQIAIEQGQPGAVMCGYNKLNGPHTCDSTFLLDHVLKKDWSYPNWVMSDWGAVGATEYANHGLDQQSGSQIDKQLWFADPLKHAVLTGEVTPARLADMTRRIIRGMAVTGVLDRPAGKPDGIIDVAAHTQTARRAAEEGLVLLRNQGNALPLPTSLKHILVVGGRSDIGVLSGGGSSQVIGSNPEPKRFVNLGGEGSMANWGVMHFQGGAPLAAIRARSPETQVRFYDGRYPQAAAQLARQADAVIVFANQWMTEGEDAPDLTLPDGQDALIDAITRANPRTVVVLQTGGAVQMPWIDRSAAILQAWYSGVSGADAIADVLFGKVNPSGRLPVTFPTSIEQFPRTELPGWGLDRGTPVTLPYTEGSDVGYRWLSKNRQQPLFAFGHGLSYSTFGYTGFKVETDKGEVNVAFDVTNTGTREGRDVPQVYLTAIDGRPVKRLVGFATPQLQAGKKQHVSVKVDQRLLARFDTAAQRWHAAPGRYRFTVAHSSSDEGVSVEAKLPGWTRKP